MVEPSALYGAEIMKKYMGMMQQVGSSLGPNNSDVCGALLELDHPFSGTDIASEARKVWAQAADFCDNPGMAAHIRSVESMVMALRGS